MREKLISCFQDTLKMSMHTFGKETEESIRSNKVYAEGFVSPKPQKKENCSIIVESGTTFAVAKKYLHIGKTAVLNFANPETPGGGVLNGAMAQEECLCRSSNLYACISAQNVAAEYYQFHRALRNYFFSDRLIYTRNVKVFKDDSAVPVIMPENEWFSVDVITCAAPYLAKRKYTNAEALLRLFKGRIKNIMEAAGDNHVDVIILGAFGCGAFKNPPRLVSQAFEEVIREEQYCKKFKQIVFAIKPTGNYCPNLEAFSDRFALYAPDADECCILLPVPSGFRFRKKPSVRAFVSSKEKDFADWQSANKYFGKQFSILGDSISTLDGYNPRGYKVFYHGENCVKSGVMQMQDTWWDKVISFFGGEMLVNNSWSGSRVAKLPNSEELFPSGCSDERTSSLHINSVNPDVIIVYLGTNDWAFGVDVLETWFTEKHQNWIGTNLLPNESCFDIAYRYMIEKIKKNYPAAEIWCCTISETYVSKVPSFKFPHKHAGIHIEAYNDIIRELASKNNCKLIDLYGFHTPYNSIDGSHPTEDGMETIAIEVIRSVAGKEVDRFLNCEGNRHQYEVVEEYTGGTKYVCKKCGKEAYTSTLFSKTVLEAGMVIGGKYKLLQVIGRGGTFTVYLAVDDRLNQQWALKVCKKNTLHPGIVDAAKQEVNMMRNFNHPSIPAIVDVFEDMEYLYVVQEYIVGETLESILKKRGVPSEETLIDLAKQLCCTLGYLHSLQPPYVYRDMKPANVILQPDGKVKLVDFGIAMVYDTLKEDTFIVGTRGYASPESFQGRTTPRSDIYSLGVTLHQLITGINPAEATCGIRPIREINPALSRELESIILKCTQADPNERYQSCDELMAALNE